MHLAGLERLKSRRSCAPVGPIMENGLQCLGRNNGVAPKADLRRRKTPSRMGGAQPAQHDRLGGGASQTAMELLGSTDRFVALDEVRSELAPF